MTDKPSVDKSPENVAGMFADIAPRYDFMNRFLSGFVDVYWRKYTAKRVPIPQGGSYLDVCTGTADLLIEYYRRYKDKASAYVGCDFCQPMLDIGEKKIQKKIPQPAVPVTLQFGDACALPFEDNSFDTITVAFGLRNTTDMTKAIQEMTASANPVERWEFWSSPCRRGSSSSACTCFISVTFCRYWARFWRAIGTRPTTTCRKASSRSHTDRNWRTRWLNAAGKTLPLPP